MKHDLLHKTSGRNKIRCKIYDSYIKLGTIYPQTKKAIKIRDKMSKVKYFSVNTRGLLLKNILILEEGEKTKNAL